MTASDDDHRELSSADVAVLRESLQLYLADFRREVAGTKNLELSPPPATQAEYEAILTRLARQAAP